MLGALARQDKRHLGLAVKPWERRAKQGFFPRKFTSHVLYCYWYDETVVNFVDLPRNPQVLGALARQDKCHLDGALKLWERRA